MVLRNSLELIFDFVYKTETIFSLSGKESLSDEERRKETWKNIVLLREAENRRIEAGPGEVRAELERLLAEKKVSYGGYNGLLNLAEDLKYAFAIPVFANVSKKAPWEIA